MFEDINLWFAKDLNEKIITIDKIDNNNKHEKYICPICGSEVIAKTGDIMSWHFAHRDAGKCSNEAQIHFWIKNELLKQGDKFKIKLDNEVKEFTCKEILIEQSYTTEFGTYNPDITIITEDNKTIYFEVANTNKKKIEEYLDMWLELNNITVEVNIKDLIKENVFNEFKAIFYEGKCFNNNHIKNKIDKFINTVKVSEKDEEFSKLSWLWYECRKYKVSNNIEPIYNIFENIEDKTLLKNIIKFLNKNRCNNITDNYEEYKKNLTLNLSNDDIIYNCSNYKYVQIEIKNIQYLRDIFYGDDVLKYFYLEEYQFCDIENNHQKLCNIVRAEKYLKDIEDCFDIYDSLCIKIKKSKEDYFTINIFNAELIYDNNIKFKMFENKNNICKELEKLNSIIKNKIEIKREKELKDGNIKKYYINIAKNIVQEYNTTISIALNTYYLENKIVYNFYNKVLKKSKKLTIKNESKINQELVSFLLRYKEFLKNNYKKEHKRQIIKNYKDNKLILCWEKFRNEIYINKNLKTYKHDTSYDVKTRTVYINDNSYKVPYYMILNYDNKTLFEKYLNCIINNAIYKPKYNTISEYLNSVSKYIYNDINYLEAYYCNYYSKCKISIRSINKGSYLLIRCKKNNEIFTYKIKEYKNRILFIENKITISKENFRIQFKTMMENDIRKYLYK